MTGEHRNSSLPKLFSIFNTPFKVATVATIVAVVISLALEKLMTGTASWTTLWIATPVAFLLGYHLSLLFTRYHEKLDEKNRQLSELTEQLQAQNAELSAFAQTVAHELKTPLGVIVGYSTLLGRENIKYQPQKIQEMAGLITKTSLKMNSIIQEMLLLASLRQIDDVQLVPLDMNTIVQEALQRLDNLILETQAKIETPHSWPRASGYGPWIEEVWSNYISNALKYGGSSPRIQLGAEEQANGQVRFWVRDFGHGLTPEQQQHIFRQFTRFNPAQIHGHGLGLSISQRIIEKLGGQVGVESQPQEGSTFYFTLPTAS